MGFTGPDSTIPVPSVADQVAAFLAGTSPQGDPLSANDTSLTSTAAAAGDDDNDDNPLFVLWAGANDVFFNPNISAAQSYLALRAAAASLAAARPGARLLAVASPDLSRLPYGFYADQLARAQLRAFTDLLASLLLTGGGGGDDFAAVVVDLRPLFDAFDYYAEPQAHGFAPLGKYGSCLVGVYGEGPSGANGTIAECDDVEGRVYWDEYQ